ncbi:hypothetical protein RCH23_000843 [Cryobacterium sp. CAN_C3]|nr:hypothetical protein [Cryobacterium sp. CAN_C3]
MTRSGRPPLVGGQAAAASLTAGLDVLGVLGVLGVLAALVGAPAVVCMAQLRDPPIRCRSTPIHGRLNGIKLGR